MVDFAKLSIRTKKQDEAKAAIRAANYNCTVLSSVGSGKGRIALDIAEELVQAGKVRTILYLCDSTRLRDSATDGFLAEIRKWYPTLERRITRECYQGMYKEVGQKYDLLIADEFDMALTKQYIKGILNNSFKYKTLYSGTITKTKRDIVNKIAPIVYEFLTEAAEDAGVVNKSKFYIYNFKMTEEESKKYVNLTKKIMVAVITEGADSDQAQFWIRKRKHFLSLLDSSYASCRKVMNWIYHMDHNNRLIVFCELQEQA